MIDTLYFIFTFLMLLAPFIALYGFQIFLFIKRLMKKGSKKSTQIIVLVLNIVIGGGVLLFSLVFGVFALDSPSSTMWDYYLAVLVMNIPNIIFIPSAIIDLCIRKRFEQ